MTSYVSALCRPDDPEIIKRLKREMAVALQVSDISKE